MGLSWIRSGLAWHKSSKIVNYIGGQSSTLSQLSYHLFTHTITPFTKPNPIIQPQYQNSSPTLSSSHPSSHISKEELVLPLRWVATTALSYICVTQHQLKERRLILFLQIYSTRPIGAESQSPPLNSKALLTQVHLLNPFIALQFLLPTFPLHHTSTPCVILATMSTSFHLIQVKS